MKGIMSKRDLLLGCVVAFFVLLFLINYLLSETSDNSGFAPDPRDPTRQIYIEDSGTQHGYIEENGVTEETGETLYSIQIIPNRK